jgi:hypothetical protein
VAKEIEMSFERVVLVVAGAFALLAGVACLVAPASFAAQAGLTTTPSGLTEIRAFYGGLQVGLGCFLIWCSRQQRLILEGLLLVVFTVGAIGLARVLGILIDREPTGYLVANLAVEAITVGLVAAAVARHRRRVHG